MMRPAPSGSMRGAKSTSTSAEGIDDGYQVVHHVGLFTAAVWRPRGVTVAPGVDGHGPVAGLAEAFTGPFPGMAGLAAPV
ncbi:MAG: hypothetical protein GY929_27675, partial [Actinomycetia bacterium]|nr:hypothetical protein [Actinomycetes bacterium]